MKRLPVLETRCVVLLAATMIVAASTPPVFAQDTPKNFVVHLARKSLPAITFEDAQGRNANLAEFNGKVVVLNIWATWCVPCRQEMPALDRLQGALGGPNFAVVPLSIDRGGSEIVTKFYTDVGIRTLPIYLDKSGKAVRELGAIGLPTTLILDHTGQEIARVVGPAEWDAPEVIEFLKPIIEKTDAPIRQTERDDLGTRFSSGPLARSYQWLKTFFVK
ncbi:MAG: TlpA family protein disulfide reductase [Bradyrhizobium sp.]